jgi:hypothetical protein
LNIEPFYILNSFFHHSGGVSLFRPFLNKQSESQDDTPMYKSGFDGDIMGLWDIYIMGYIMVYIMVYVYISAYNVI